MVEGADQLRTPVLQPGADGTGRAASPIQEPAGTADELTDRAALT